MPGARAIASTNWSRSSRTSGSGLAARRSTMPPGFQSSRDRLAAKSTRGLQSYARGSIVTLAALIFVGAVAASASAGPRTGPNGLPKPAQDGLIAYSYCGDIYIGDPATGDTKPIVTSPAYDAEPIFAPGGRRIAFIRGNPQTANAKLVAVRADGSDERLILPRGRKHQGFGSWGWTPNGASLVVELDRAPFTYPSSDGELSLFDSFGSGKERILTPPLPPHIGAHYWGHNQVAPMFRPPSGDRILVGDWNEVRMFDRRLRTATSLNRALKAYEPYHPNYLTWSPDGTHILFDLGLYTKTPSLTQFPTPRKGGGQFVMSGRGDELHRIGDERTNGFWQWSPDGSRIAFERVNGRTDRAVLVILDLKSGKERPLHSTSTRGKDAGARFPTTTYNNVLHHWFYESWIWAPDGRSLLVLENHRTRPWIVDVESDTVTKLPWLADSMPSWQRVTRG